MGSFVHKSQHETEALLAKLAPAVPVFSFDTRGVTTPDELHQRIAASLPADPPMGARSGHWDAVSDSLWGGFDEFGADRVWVVWRGSLELADALPRSQLMLIDIFTTISTTLRDPRFNSSPVELCVVLVES